VLRLCHHCKENKSETGIWKQKLIGSCMERVGEEIDNDTLAVEEQQEPYVGFFFS